MWENIFQDLKTHFLDFENMLKISLTRIPPAKQESIADSQEASGCSREVGRKLKDLILRYFSKSVQQERQKGENIGNYWQAIFIGGTENSEENWYILYSLYYVYVYTIHKAVASIKKDIEMETEILWRQTNY